MMTDQSGLQTRDRKWLQAAASSEMLVSTFFNDCMTVHRNRFLVNKTTDALNSNFIGITTLHVSGSLSAHHQEFLAVHLLWYILWSCDHLLPGAGWNCSSVHLLVLFTKSW